METKWVNLSQAAKVAGVSRQTIYNWIQQNKIFTVEFGSSSFISIKNLEPYIIHQCSTCYHRTDSHCACREEIIKNCPDWHTKLV